MTLTRYVAWLRGINVGGANKVPMKDLRTLVETLGHENVGTYLQSGNVVLDSDSPPKRIAKELQEAISRAFELKVPVILRTREDLERVVADNPFLAKEPKLSSLHVMFLADSPTARAIKTLDPDRSPPDELEVVGREIYLRFPHGSGRTKLTIDYFEKKLGTRATARNWNTVTKVLNRMKGS
jgi:uncharacterized protein (DUF1697 family)